MTDMNVENVKDAVEEGGEKLTGDGAGGNGFVKRYGIPAAAGIGTLAATYAARKAPELDRVKHQGGVGGLAAKALSIGGGKGKGGKGGKKTRRLPIQRWTDIAAPRA